MGQIQTPPGGSSERGTWTPIFEFQTNGDLAVVYTDQEGAYELIEGVLTFSFSVRGTLTYTTATGQLRISGFPFACAIAGATSPFTIQTVTAFTWPAGRSQVAGAMLAATIDSVIAANGSAINASIVNQSNIVTGTDLGIRGSGSFTI